MGGEKKEEKENIQNRGNSDTVEDSPPTNAPLKRAAELN